MPILRELHEGMKDENVKIIGINLGFNDKMEDVIKVLEDNDIEFPILFDEGMVATEYGIRSIPTNVLINKEGIVEANIIGMFDHAKMIETINSLK